MNALTMDGRIPDTPLVVDNFHTTSHNETLLFFLSHAHADHMNGLSSEFDRGPIFCSDVTRSLVLLRFPGRGRLKPRLRGLEFNREYTIQVPVKRKKNASGSFGKMENVNVTLISTDHCPGAAMFLFEGSFGKILHTGDYRFKSPDEYRQQPMLRTLAEAGLCKCVYFDSTFCAPGCDFPARAKGVELLCHLLTRAGFSPRHRSSSSSSFSSSSSSRSYSSSRPVYLALDMLGFEPVLWILAHAFGCKFHVSDRLRKRLLVVDRYFVNILEPPARLLTTTEGAAAQAAAAAAAGGTAKTMNTKSSAASSTAAESASSAGRVVFHIVSADELKNECVAALESHRQRQTRNPALRSQEPLLVKLSTQWFVHYSALDKSKWSKVCVDRFGVHHILYSAHASWQESLDFLSYLKPEFAVPLCNPSRATASHVRNNSSTSAMAPLAEVAEWVGTGLRLVDANCPTRVVPPHASTSIPNYGVNARSAHQQRLAHHPRTSAMDANGNIGPYRRRASGAAFGSDSHAPSSSTGSEVASAYAAYEAAQQSAPSSSSSSAAAAAATTTSTITTVSAETGLPAPPVLSPLPSGGPSTQLRRSHSAPLHGSQEDRQDDELCRCDYPRQLEEHRREEERKRAAQEEAEERAWQQSGEPDSQLQGPGDRAHGHKRKRSSPAGEASFWRQFLAHEPATKKQRHSHSGGRRSSFGWSRGHRRYHGRQRGGRLSRVQRENRRAQRAAARSTAELEARARRHGVADEDGVVRCPACSGVVQGPDEGMLPPRWFGPVLEPWFYQLSQPSAWRDVPVYLYLSNKDKDKREWASETLQKLHARPCDSISRVLVLDVRKFGSRRTLQLLIQKVRDALSVRVVLERRKAWARLAEEQQQEQSSSKKEGEVLPQRPGAGGAERREPPPAGERKKTKEEEGRGVVARAKKEESVSVQALAASSLARGRESVKGEAADDEPACSTGQGGKRGKRNKEKERMRKQRRKKEAAEAASIKAELEREPVSEFELAHAARLEEQVVILNVDVFRPLRLGTEFHITDYVLWTSASFELLRGSPPLGESRSSTPFLGASTARQAVNHTRPLILPFPAAASAAVTAAAAADDDDVATPVPPTRPPSLAPASPVKLSPARARRRAEAPAPEEAVIDLCSLSE